MQVKYILGHFQLDLGSFLISLNSSEITLWQSVCPAYTSVNYNNLNLVLGTSSCCHNMTQVLVKLTPIHCGSCPRMVQTWSQFSPWSKKMSPVMRWLNETRDKMPGPWKTTRFATIRWDTIPVMFHLISWDKVAA
jgi:hypothetical protein